MAKTIGCVGDTDCICHHFERDVHKVFLFLYSCTPLSSSTSPTLVRWQSKAIDRGNKDPDTAVGVVGKEGDKGKIKIVGCSLSRTKQCEGSVDSIYSGWGPNQC